MLASTDGTPFAVTEVLRELAARGALVAEAADGTWAARDPSAVAEAEELGRAGQRSAIRRRAARQTGLAAEVLALLALLAREAPAQTVATAAGVEPRAVLDALAALTAAGLVRLGERGWATAHDLVAETVTAGLGAGERGRLHGLLARALSAEDADPSETARHHRAAGDADRGGTGVPACGRAGIGGPRHGRGRRTGVGGSGVGACGPGAGCGPARRASRGAGRARRPWRRR